MDGRIDNEDKTNVIKNICRMILGKDNDAARGIIESEYKFTGRSVSERKYGDTEKMKLFIRDGFIDRYTGKKLVIPGILKVLSMYFPEEFPYDSHWKMDKCHISYWELIPTVDHIVPLAIGGADDENNYVTTSMMSNAVKSNFTLEQLGWKLYDRGDIREYDGLMGIFIKLVDADEKLLEDGYIKKWYRLVKRFYIID